MVQTALFEAAHIMLTRATRFPRLKGCALDGAQRRGMQRAKNGIFAGSKAGGERAAAIYSVIETAKLNGIEPQAYILGDALRTEVSDASLHASEKLTP